MKNLKMSQKLGLGFGSVTLLVCLMGYMAYSALDKASGSIMKLSTGYMPVSDLASNMTDNARQLRFFMTQYGTSGKKENYVAAEKYFDTMGKEFVELQKVSAANPDLRATATAVREYQPLHGAYKDGMTATDKSMDKVNTLLKNMSASAATAEGTVAELLRNISDGQAGFHAQGDMDAMLRNSRNLYAATEVALKFKEIRRIYANARPTFDVSVRPQIDKLAEESLALLEGLTATIVRPQVREHLKVATTAAKTYLTDMTSMLLAWDELNTASSSRLNAYTQLIDLLDKLNITANKNATTFARNADKAVSDSTVQLVGISCGVVVMSILLAFVITRIITGPLNRSMRFAEAVAAGNLNDRNDRLDVHSRDEVGKLADALRSMVASLKAKIAEANEQAKQAHAMGEEARAAMEEAKQAQAAAESAKREGMLTAAHQLEGIVEVVSSASTQLSAQVEESERGAAITSERLTETATAMEEMNATVLEVARSAGNAAQVSTDAKTKAEHGAGIVEDVVKCINDVERQSTQLKADMVQLGQQAEAIGTIMNVISDIADQTNLLALNAAIEAARAGEAGRGFAVVADEVRKLAEKTMQATVEVGNAIKGVQQSADKNMKGVDASSEIIAKATELVRQAGASLKEIVSLVENSADQVRTIATAAEEQSSTSEEINRSLGSVSNASSETARAMAEAAQAVSDLSQQAQQLSRLIDDMKRG